MSVVEVMRTRLWRASELGVPIREFLQRELDAGAVLQSHVNARVAQAGRETEEAARLLEQELQTDEGAMRLRTRQMPHDDAG